MDCNTLLALDSEIAQSVFFVRESLDMYQMTLGGRLLFLSFQINHREFTIIALIMLEDSLSRGKPSYADLPVATLP